ncbi:hypothetical protein Dimus_015703, partial [Dionaea muscipula]
MKTTNNHSLHIAAVARATTAEKTALLIATLAHWFTSRPCSRSTNAAHAVTAAVRRSHCRKPPPREPSLLSSRVAAHHADCCIVNLFALRCLLIGQAPTRVVESVACRCGAQLEPAALLMRCCVAVRVAASGDHRTPLLGRPPHAAAATADANFIAAAAIISWMHTIAMTCTWAETTKTSTTGHGFDEEPVFVRIERTETGNRLKYSLIPFDFVCAIEDFGLFGTDLGFLVWVMARWEILLSSGTLSSLLLCPTPMTLTEVYCSLSKEYDLSVDLPILRSASLDDFHQGRNANSLSLYFGEDPARCAFEQ